MKRQHSSSSWTIILYLSTSRNWGCAGHIKGLFEFKYGREPKRGLRDQKDDIVQISGVLFNWLQVLHLYNSLETLTQEAQSRRREMMVAILLLSRMVETRFSWPFSRRPCSNHIDL